MKRILFTLICASLTVACVQETLQEAVTPAEDTGKVYASIEGMGTRVQLNSEKQTVWTEKDTIAVFGPDRWAYYAFDGKTGDRNGSFSWLADEQVEGDWLSVINGHYAIYSYRSLWGIWVENTGKPYLYVRIADVQNYMKDSYGLHANAMLGKSDDGGKTFNFINLFGYLRLSLTGSKSVRRIQMIDNTYSYIAGVFYFTPDNPDEMVGYGEYNNVVTLDCGEEGVQLSEKPTDFYIALPPCQMKAGIAILVEFTDGTNFYQRTSKPVSLRRNVIQPMATLSTDDDFDWQYVRINHIGPYIDSPWIDGKSSVSGYLFWGDDYWNALDMYSYRHQYGDGKDSHEFVMKVRDAEAIEFYNLKGMTKIDLSEF